MRNRNEIRKWLRKIGFSSLKTDDSAMGQDAMTEIVEVEKVFANEHLKEFIRKYEAMRISKGSNHYFTTLGINFKNESVDSVKFYAHILEEMTEDEILHFLPTSKDYERFRQLKNASSDITKSSVGTILEIKFKPSLAQPTFGFFYMLRNTEESYLAAGCPKNLPSAVRNRCIGLGVNFEYNQVQEIFKKYYYFDTDKDKSYFEKRLGVPLLGSFFEYAEGDGLSKMNNYSGVISDFWDKDRNFSSKERRIMRYLFDKYSLSIIGYGTYENHPIRSVYFRERTDEGDSLRNMPNLYSNVFKSVSDNMQIL
ncbi:MAG: hypothetical protein K9J17_15500 [Flavobacteriales bacterium]|nr:hypothetical protein [Flavobacteriales bacterium]